MVEVVDEQWILLRNTFFYKKAGMAILKIVRTKHKRLVKQIVPVEGAWCRSITTKKSAGTGRWQ